MVRTIYAHLDSRLSRHASPTYGKWTALAWNNEKTLTILEEFITYFLDIKYFCTK